jgi:hypothetical protein
VAWRLASAIANLLLVFLTLAAGLAMVFAPLIVRRGLFVLAPDLPAGQEALTVSLLRIMLPTVVIFGLSGLVMGILNAHQRFWLPAIAPAMYCWESWRAAAPPGEHLPAGGGALLGACCACGAEPGLLPGQLYGRLGTKMRITPGDFC